MGAPSLWTSLITGLVTGLIALGGVIYTQLRSDRREAQRWNREREREREQWAREDAARTFDHRREQYVDFYELMVSQAKDIHEVDVTPGRAMPSDWQYPLYQRLLRLRVFATPAASKAAGEAYSALYDWGNAVAKQPSASTEDGPHVLWTDDGDEIPVGYHLDEEQNYDVAAAKLLEVIRADLGVPVDK